MHRFDDGEANYVERLKKSFKQGNPLIPSLHPYCSNKPTSRKNYDFSLSEGDPFCIGEPKLFSHCLLEAILNELGMIALFSRYKHLTNYEFDLVGFFRLLIYGRILNPDSKIKTARQNENYYIPIVKEPYEYNIYDTLDFIYDYKMSIIKKLNQSLVSSFKRTTNIIFYDVTNFYFEIERPDNDVEEDGETTKGLRKFGVNKEERRLPIVQMGLFMDQQGIPISIEVFSGNTLDHLTVIEALNKSINNLELSRYIFVGDRGMYRGNNTAHLINSNHGYIISKSIEKTTKVEKDWIFDQKGYIEENKSFKYKSKIIKRKVTINSTQQQEIVEKVVVYWSERFYKKQVAENKSFLDFIEKLEQNPENFRISKSQTSTIKRFIKKDCINDDTGEIVDSSKLKMLIDYDKVNKFKQSMGYYQIVTSELTMPEKEVIDTYHGLSRIERQFQMMKSDLETRPLRVRTPEHIEAHLLSCMIALIVVRIIQNKIVCYKGETPGKHWELGLSAARIQEALNKWTVDPLSMDYYRFNNINDPDLQLILNAFGIKIPCQLYKKGELREIKTKIKV